MTVTFWDGVQAVGMGAFIFTYTRMLVQLRRTRSVVRKMVVAGITETVLRMDPSARQKLFEELDGE